MSGHDIKEQYLGIENFFMGHDDVVSKLIGGKATQHAWALKDLSQANEDGERSCRIVQKAVEQAAAGRQADWVIMVSESHEILSLDTWIVTVVDKAVEEARSLATGYGDLDLNIQTQLSCGRQLESFHSGDWAKERLSAMFETSHFEEEEPIVCKMSSPITYLLERLDRDLGHVTEGGIRHPYQCSVGVGAICLRLAATADEPERIIPLVRRARVSNVAGALLGMKEDLKDRFDGLIATIREQQENLKLLPEGWPNQQVWESMMEWAAKRFAGDSGLMGSELFDDDRWVMQNLPHEVHRKRDAEGPAVAAEPLSGFLELAKQMTERRLAKSMQSKLEEFRGDRGAAPARRPPSHRI